MRRIINLFIIAVLGIFIFNIEDIYAGNFYQGRVVDDYDIFVGGEQIRPDHLVITDGNGGTVTYDPEENILTFNNYTYNGDGYMVPNGAYRREYNGVFMDVPNITVVFEGTNNIILSGKDIPESHTVEYPANAGILIARGENLTIKGNGTLNLNIGRSVQSAGIVMFHNNIVFEDLTINIIDPDRDSLSFVGINDGNVNTSDNICTTRFNNVTINSDYSFIDQGTGIYAYKDLYFNNSNINFTSSTNTTSMPYTIDTNSMHVTNSNIIIKNTNGIGSPAAIFFRDAFVLDGGLVDIENNLTYTPASSAYFTSGGIVAGKTLNVLGGKLHVRGYDIKTNIWGLTNPVTTGEIKYFKATAGPEEDAQFTTDFSVFNSPSTVAYEMTLEVYTYDLIDGDKQEINNDSGEYKLVIDGNPENFQSLSIDNTEFVKNEDYTVVEDEIILTDTGLNKLKELTVEEHTFTVVYLVDNQNVVVDGTLTVNTVAEPDPVIDPVNPDPIVDPEPTEEDINPQTGDIILIYGMIFIISVSGLFKIVRKATNS